MGPLLQHLNQTREMQASGAHPSLASFILGIIVMVALPLVTSLILHYVSKFEEFMSSDKDWRDC